MKRATFLGFTLAAAGPLAIVAASVTSPSSSELIDFEGIPTGTIATTVVTSGGGSVGVSGFNPDLGATNAAVIFDSANPTGDDADLGTPNQNFGGPGIGAGGAGGPFANTRALGKVLIVAEDLVDENSDGLVDDPDDADVLGARLDLDFSAIAPVHFTSFTIIDVEASEEAATVEFFDAANASLGLVILPIVGDNGVATVPLDVSGVWRVEVTLNGSGAIDELDFFREGSIGDKVFCDLNDDGVQDAIEPGIAGVKVDLLCAGPDCVFGTADDIVDCQTTDANGCYLFTGLPAGMCIVSVDPNSVPNKDPGKCPNPAPVDLQPGEVFLDADFCFVPPPTGGGEGCTPGYWKQPHHFGFWAPPYTPGTPFADVFEDAFPNMTLLDVLKNGGGGLDALGRHTVAALLNAASPLVSYNLTTGEVIDMFNAVYPGTKAEYNALKDIFENFNEQGCPLGNSRRAQR